MDASMTVDTMPTPPIVDEEPEKKDRRRRKALLLLLVLLLAFLAILIIWYLIFRQPIQPLPLIPESQIPTYSTSIYGVTRPVGVAVSPSGDRIYVTEGSAAGGGVVFDASGKQIGDMVPPESTGTDHQPVYAAVNPVTAEVYVSDRLTGTIYIYDADGRYQRELALAEPRPGWQPMGLAFDPAGNLYVTDLSGPFQGVLVIDRSGKVTRTLGEDAQLNFPNEIAVAKDGTIYVTDSNNGRLVSFGTDGKVVIGVGRGVARGNLGLPRGLAIDESGRIFTADTTAQGIEIYKVPGGADKPVEHLGAFGAPGAGDGQFSFPNGLAVDSRGRVYVADTFNDRVQIWSY